MNSKGQGRIDETYKTSGSNKLLRIVASPTPQAYLRFDSSELIVEILFHRFFASLRFTDLRHFNARGVSMLLREEPIHVASVFV